jgi:hypothetical protein
VNQRRPARGRPPAGGGTQGTSAGARGALLLGVAVILGIVLLQKFDTKGSTGGSVSATSVPARETSTTRRVGLTTVPAVTSTTAKARAKADVKILVANGSGQKGLAGVTTTALKNVGYTNAGTPTDATTAVDKTAVQFADGYEAEARELAAALSLPPTVVSRLASPPVAAADLDDAKVVVILGADVVNTTSSTGATTSSTRKP